MKKFKSYCLLREANEINEAWGDSFNPNSDADADELSVFQKIQRLFRILKRIVEKGGANANDIEGLKIRIGEVAKELHQFEGLYKNIIQDPQIGKVMRWIKNIISEIPELSEETSDLTNAWNKCRGKYAQQARTANSERRDQERLRPITNKFGLQMPKMI